MRAFVSTLTESELTHYLTKQLSFFFPDGKDIDDSIIHFCATKALKRIRISFEPLNSRYYNKGKASLFNHLHGDHYSAFLYLISNEVYKAGDEPLASKLFLLNKSLFGIDAFYALSLPDHFLFVHPLGTILGNAHYDDFFVVYQGVTVGSTTHGVYPVFSVKTILYSNSSIIGKCKIGQNFVLGANASLVNCDIPDSKVVVGNYPAHRILDNQNSLINSYYNL
jgi:serine O-acetyltransferase